MKSSMQIPLEPFDYPRVNPGRNTLTVDASATGDYWKTCTGQWARITNYTGVMNYMGARFTAESSGHDPCHSGHCQAWPALSG